MKQMYGGRMRSLYRGQGVVRLVVLTAACWILWVAPALATVPCSGVQTALNTSSSGAVIALDANASCNSGNATLPWQLPAHPVTLDGNGATVDAGGTKRAIVGTDVGATTIKNFTFKNGASPTNGGAISIVGSSSPIITSSQFLANTAVAAGGAIYLDVDGTANVASSSFGDGTAGNANTAGAGGAIWATSSTLALEDSVLDSNTATGAGGGLFATQPLGFTASLILRGNRIEGNQAGADGAGAYVQVGGLVAVVVDNVVTGNLVSPSASATSATGGGLWLSGSNSSLQQAYFTNNKIKQNGVQPGGDPTNFNTFGGGVYLSGMGFSSTNDVLTKNTLPAHGSGGTNVSGGAAIALSGCGAGASASLTDAVLAANAVVGDARGAALDANCSGGSLALGLLNTTITKNVANGGSAGIAGGSDDVLSATNTILTENIGGADVAWANVSAGATTVRYSDICDPASPAQAWPGEANICAHPALLDPANGDVRQLIASPTIDAGLTSAVPFDLGGDYAGDPRLVATRGDTKIVDIGADERAAVPCEFLVADLATAPAGSRITLQEGQICIGNFLLPALPITLDAEGTGATLDGNLAGPVLSGTDASTTTLRNLTIRNGRNAADGGGVALTGASSPTLKDMRFVANASDSRGGAVALTDTPSGATVTVDNVDFGDGTAANANTATTGGGAWIAGAADVVLNKSRFLGNSAIDAGGGALIETTGKVAASANRFTGNSLNPTGATGLATGAGLDLLDNSDATLVANVFQGNSISSGGAPGIELRGGALHSANVPLEATSDQFIANSIPVANGNATGSALASDCGAGGAPATFTNLVAAGNGTGGPAVTYSCPTAATLTLQNASVVSNTGGGVSGTANAGLVVRNSILTGNGADVAGFGTRTVGFSDVCAGGSPLAGAGNICADPQLLNPAAGDVHQVIGSPTVDAGSNALVPSGLVTDFEAGPRVADGNRDGDAVVDIGADELPTQARLIPGQPDGSAPGEQPKQNVAGASGGGKTPVKTSRLLRLINVRQKKGVLTLTFRAGKAGTLETLTTYKASKKKTKRRTSRAAKLKAAKGQKVFGRAKKKVKKAGKVVVKLKPSKVARAWLKKKKKLPVRIVAQLKPPKAKAGKVKRRYTVKAPKARKKKKK